MNEFCGSKCGSSKFHVSGPVHEAAKAPSAGENEHSCRRNRNGACFVSGIKVIILHCVSLSIRWVTFYGVRGPSILLFCPGVTQARIFAERASAPHARRKMDDTSMPISLMWLLWDAMKLTLAFSPLLLIAAIFITNPESGADRNARSDFSLDPVE